MDNQISSNLMEIITHGTREFPFIIYQRTFTKSSLSYISCHWHNEIEIIYCYSGSISCSVNEKTYILDENSFTIINSNALHQINMIDEAKWYAIVFDPKFIYGFSESLIKTEAFDNIKFNNLLIKNTSIINSLHKLINIYFSDVSFKSLRVNSLLSEIYLSILDEATSNDEVIKSESKAHSIRIRQILDFINNNYKSKITIDDISKEIGLCRSEVCKLFKAEIGISIADYILKLRVEKSIPLLLSNKLNITEIASQSGFNSSSYYAEAFKKLINMTPLEYKKKNRK
ncbi:MAG: AraC family transcriptional regulator [Anaeroplasmataceae bacterium]